MSQGKERRAISRHGKLLSKIRKNWRCKGCGRVMPKGSWVLLWHVWHDYQQEKWRLCSDCQRIIYECDGRRPICHQQDTYIIRDLCESCDGFPFCDKVDYLRESEPGSLHMGDLGIYQERWDDDDISTEQQ